MMGRRRERGSVLIEFTAAASFLLLFVAAISDLSRVFYYSDIATCAAHAGIQYAIARPGASNNLKAIEQAALVEPGALPGLTATATEFPAGGTADQRAKYLQVITKYPLRTFVSWPGFENPVIVTGRAIVRIE
jgi:Flp pilus assembly protein TadG